MILKSKNFQLILAIVIGLVIFVLPRPEGTQFKINGDVEKILAKHVSDIFTVLSYDKKDNSYILKAKDRKDKRINAVFLEKKIKELKIEKARVDYVNGLSPKAKRFLCVLAVLVFLFVVEPVPLEITAICIGGLLVVMQITDAKNAWAPYMHPVVVFIMCCLIFAITLDKVGITERIGQFVVKKAGSSVTKFTFIIAISLGIGSAVMHDAAACAIGIVTMLPLMKAAGIEPNTRTAKFMMLSLPFACSCGGMGTLMGGGRCMVSAAFLKEFTGIEITFFDWIKFAMPAAIITVPIAVLIIYFVYKPDPNIKLPKFEGEIGPLKKNEKKVLFIIGATFLLWLTKGYHGVHYSITGMLGVTTLVIFGILKWNDIQDNLEWGTALFIFGGGISLGLAMGYSGAANYFAHIFFPLIQGGGWFLLFTGVAVFGALVTNAMANVAAAALILPIVIPMAQMEGVDPRVLSLCLGTATSFAMLLVIGCPPNAIAYSYRYFKSSDLTKAGLVATPILLTVLFIVLGIWWSIIGLV